MDGTPRSHRSPSLVVRLRAIVARRPVASFVLLAYALSWAWWWSLLAADHVVRAGIGWPSHMPGLMGPAIAAAVVIAAAEGPSGLRRWAGRLFRWRIGWPWLAVAAIIIAGAVAALMTPGTRSGTGSWNDYPGLPAWWGGVATLAVVLVVNGAGEEAGWRGFLVDRLARQRSLLVTALLVALAWAVWHVPLFFVLASFQAFAPATVVGWAIGLASGSIVLTWLYLRGRRSILLVAVWHTAFNFTSATPAASGATAAVTSTMVMIAALAIVVADLRKGRLQAPAIPTS